MANLPISGLPIASALDGTELLPFVQGGVTTQATAQDILDANLPVTSSGITVSGDIVPTTPRGATLGSIDKPFAELYLQSGSISIESDTPGDPSAIISNNNGNLDVSVGGMRLVQPGNSFIAETGSFSFISGSMTQVGDYIRIGDTITTGSVNFSGSFEASLQEDYVWIGDSNNRSIETPISSLSTYLTGSLVKSAYGSFYSTQNQAGVANQIQVITHNVTDFASGVSVVSGSQITFAEAGIYTLISTMQYQETGGGTATITGWLRKNGVDVADSATDLKLKGNGDRDLYAINYFVSASAGDYVEFCWSSNDVDTEILYIAPRTSPTRPAVPSVITTVNRVG
jgi:hypothetical protein